VDAMIRTSSHDLALALRHYLAGAEEEARLQAYQVAREGMAAGLSLLDLVANHHEALAIVLSTFVTPTEAIRAVRASAELLTESLGPFEMAHRGFQEANETLVRVNESLQSEIAERIEAENAARLARAEAERANNAKSEFLSRMSHELRTPLNAVLGFAQLLQMDELRPDQRESVEQIEKAGRHLLDLINEVLDIARVESGHLSLSVEPVEVGSAVAEALLLVRPLAAEREISVTLQESSALSLYARADRQRIKQVLLNLLSNGIKYNRERGSLVIRCSEVPGGRVRLEVADDGPGIPSDRLHRLFTPFERLGAEGTGVEGTGLGLALSKRLVEAMGGALEVSTAPGQGSTFSVELETAGSPEQDSALSKRDELAPGIDPPLHGTLLYIEDNQANVRLIERVVSRLPNCRLITAMQGSLGLDLAHQHDPDIVLLDLHLPDIPGAEVLRRLREDPTTHDIPVIVISADATPSQIRKLLAEGADAYLTKPLDVQRFLQLVRETLKKRILDRKG
jgi:signal transduction histidine kinase/ActR/RegA family two-component response regulator